MATETVWRPDYLPSDVAEKAIANRSVFTRDGLYVRKVGHAFVDFMAKQGTVKYDKYLTIRPPYDDHGEVYVNKNTKRQFYVTQPYLPCYDRRGLQPDQAEKVERGNYPEFAGKVWEEIHLMPRWPEFKSDVTTRVFNKSMEFARDHGLTLMEVSVDKSWYYPGKTIKIEFMQNGRNGEADIGEQTENVSDNVVQIIYRPLTKEVRYRILERDKFTCQYCGQSAPQVVLHADHVLPVSKWLETHKDYVDCNDESNLKAACSSCNLGKGARG